jgi:hypothetical protein
MPTPSGGVYSINAEPIGNIPPAEAEMRYHAQTKGHAMAA